MCRALLYGWGHLLKRLHVRAFAIAALIIGGLLGACGRKPPPPMPSPTNSDTERPRVFLARPTAPLVAPACAQLIVRSDGGNGAPESTDENSVRQRSVAFRNNCSFPIRVLYSARANGWPSKLTEMLRPGETSKSVRMKGGFDRPGYVVCSYERVPASAACRLNRGG